MVAGVVASAALVAVVVEPYEYGAYIVVDV